MGSSISPASIIYDSAGNEKATELNPLIIRPNRYGLSAFGAQRTVHPRSLADLGFAYEIDSRDWDTSTATAGTVTYLPNEKCASLSVTATSGSAAKLRANTYFRYQAGKGQRVLMTCVHADTGQANQTRRWGYFDDQNGLFFQLSGTTFGICRRTYTTGTAVDNVLNQSSFNVDKLDGSGTSGFNLDLTKDNIYEIVFQWLGAGTVWFYVNGILAHQILNANTLSTSYMATGALPISLEVVNTGASTTSSMKFFCASVQSEGGEEAGGYGHGAFNPSDKVIGTTELPLLSIRVKSTYNSLPNRALLLPIFMSITTEGSRLGYRLIWNSTLTSPTWTSVATASFAEYDVAATAVSGGETIFRSMIPNTNDSRELNLEKIFNELGRKIQMTSFGGVQQVFTIAAVNEAAGNTNARASLDWTEIR